MSVVKKQTVTKAWLNSAANASTLNAGDFYVVERDGTYQAISSGAVVKIKDVELPQFGSAALLNAVTALMTGTPQVTAFATSSLTTENLNSFTYQASPGIHFQSQAVRGTVALNYPMDGSAGALLVLPGPYAGMHVFARFNGTANTVLYVRASTSLTTWAPWTKVVTVGEANTFSAVNTFSQAPVFNGGAKLGESGPTIKQRVVTGTTHATAGTAVGISPGVPIDSILSIDMWVTEAGGGLYPPNFVASANRLYHLRMTSTAIWVQVDASSTALASRPYRILVTYTA